MKGINTTPHAKREIKYTKCLSIHINLIQAELKFLLGQKNSALLVLNLFIDRPRDEGVRTMSNKSKDGGGRDGKCCRRR